MNKIHRLKTWPEPFEGLCRGVKTFEIRKDDREYKVGDFLVLDEWDPATQGYTSEQPLVRRVRFLLKEFGLSDGHVAMSIEDVDLSTKLAVLALSPLRSTPPATEDDEP